MKTNEQINELIRQNKFDSVRYAAIERLTFSRIDVQAWTFLGQAMVGLKRGKMAKLCFERCIFLDPFALWTQQALNDATSAGVGSEDKRTLKLLEVNHVTISACILTYNNSPTIRQCIQALQGAVDEIIVVDTGSTDDTVEIIQSLGITVYHFNWIDDFSAARNYALSLATSEWILSIDSDELLYPQDRQNIHLVTSLFQDDIFVLNIFQMNHIKDSVSPSQVPRLFRKDYFTWQSPIHEEPVLCQSSPISIPNSQTVNIRVYHYGYDPDVSDLQAKFERNVRMLRKAIKNEPTQFSYFYYLGRELVIAEEYREAIELLNTAYDISANVPGSPLLPEISELLADAYVKLNRLQDAIRCLEIITAKCPEHPGGWYLLGILLVTEDPTRSLECLYRAKEVGTIYRGPSNFDAEIAAWKADHFININNLEKHK